MCWDGASTDAAGTVPVLGREAKHGDTTSLGLGGARVRAPLPFLSLLLSLACSQEVHSDASPCPCCPCRNALGLVPVHHALQHPSCQNGLGGAVTFCPSPMCCICPCWDHAAWKMLSVTFLCRPGSGVVLFQPHWVLISMCLTESCVPGG